LDHRRNAKNGVWFISNNGVFLPLDKEEIILSQIDIQAVMWMASIIINLKIE